MNGSRQRFDAADVLLRSQGRQRDDGVGMIRRGDVDGVDPVALGPQHLAEIAIATCLRPMIERLAGVGVIDVAEGGDVEAGLLELLELSETHPTYANPGQGGFLARRFPSVEPDHARGEELNAGPCGRGIAKKSTTRGRSPDSHHETPLIEAV